MKTKSFVWLMVAVFAILALSHCASVRAVEVYRIEYNRQRPYVVREWQLWSLSQMRQSTWPVLSFGGKPVECAAISIYPDWMERNLIPATEPQFLVIRLDTGRKVLPAARHFVRPDPGSPR